MTKLTECVLTGVLAGHTQIPRVIWILFFHLVPLAFSGLDSSWCLPASGGIFLERSDSADDETPLTHCLGSVPALLGKLSAVVPFRSLHPRHDALSGWRSCWQAW